MRVSRFWFMYVDHSGRLLGILIVDSPSLRQVRDLACLEGTEIGAWYFEAYELDRESSNVIPADVIGRMLSPDDVCKLLRGLEIQTIQKKPAPLFMSRRDSAPMRSRVLH